MFDNHENNNSSPLKEGNEYDVKIEDTGRSGDGIARVEGFVIFIPDTKVGQEVKIKVDSIRRNFAFGSVVN